MILKKGDLLKILSEEINKTIIKEELEPEAVQKIVDKLIKKLDSIDISLDLIYGSLIGGGQAAAVTRASQRALCRAMQARASTRHHPHPSPTPATMNEGKIDVWKIINEEVDNYLQEIELTPEEEEIDKQLETWLEGDLSWEEVEAMSSSTGLSTDEVEKAGEQIKAAKPADKPKLAAKLKSFIKKKKAKSGGVIGDKKSGKEVMKHRLGRFVFKKLGQALMGKEDFETLGGAERKGMYDIIFKNADLTSDEFKDLKTTQIKHMKPRELIKTLDIPKDDLEDAKEEGEEAAEEGGEGEPPSKVKLSKETPLSINTRQKAAKIGGVKELPLNMYMQKLGLDNRTAQKIAKRIGDYLKQRKVPIAEALDNGFIDNLIEEIVKYIAVDEVVRAPGASKESKEEFDKKFQQIRDKKTEYAAQVNTIEAELQLPELAKPEYTRLRKSLKSYKQKILSLDSDLEVMVRAHAGWKKRTGAEKAEKRGALRGVGAEAGIMGKIVSRFVSDNQDLLAADKNLKGIFDDPAKFSKFVNKIRKNVKRMMVRRGYEEDEINKLMESLEKDIEHEV